MDPHTIHAKRSFFYLIAANTQAGSPHAKEDLEKWKRIWRIWAFGLEEEAQSLIRKRQPCIQEFLRIFGEELVKLGTEVWKLQTDALFEASFN